KITLELGAKFPGEMSAKTAQGKTITGPDVAEFVTYEPPAQVVNRNINFGQRDGLFHVSIGPDGTVTSVRPIKSLGVKELDERATQRLMKMKFRPGTLTEAQIPVNFSTFRR
ncbi:MAG TPA: TonB family protein, partial [Chthoniobacterales bacterium]|nr:TonB family protein [Chthoniobacterales bacterium]